MDHQMKIKQKEQNSLKRAEKAFQLAISDVYPLIADRIIASRLSSSQKEAAFAHSFSLLKKYILYGKEGTDANPFNYLDSIGC